MASDPMHLFRRGGHHDVATEGSEVRAYCRSTLVTKYDALDRLEPRFASIELKYWKLPNLHQFRARPEVLRARQATRRELLLRAFGD